MKTKVPSLISFLIRKYNSSFEVNHGVKSVGPPCSIGLLCTGWTPLHFAAYEGHADVVDSLLSAGAVPDARDRQGDTPETWALEWENYKSAMLLADAAKKMRGEGEDKQGKEQVRMF